MTIQYRRYSLTIEALDTLSLPPYKGSTMRGGFGNALKRIVCALKRQQCTGCVLKASCIYSYIFETSPMEDTNVMNMNKYEQIPHPFIIEPPDESGRVFNQSQRLTFNLILIGNAGQYLPYFILAFIELGKIGLGMGRGKYRLINVSDDKRTVYNIDDGQIIPGLPEELHISETFEFDKSSHRELKLRLITPVRILFNRDMVVKLEFNILLRALMRRIYLLHYFHCKESELLWNHKNIIDNAAYVSILEDKLEWWDWQRYSSRQKTHMKMGGLTGTIIYRGDIEPFYSIVKAGEVLHVGKGTSFGLGKYTIANQL
ncbi:MAG: CRISPR system precrRNA processing endoribonuclease RAMP protein Cas6 [Nitrospirae bacterium]|nr:CRISPR system precrRNA processing endoribonuclease RAMP protein Cas6 [Nitrospirota bacterium]